MERILKASGADEETKQKSVMRMISKRIPAPVSEEFQRGFVNRWPNVKPSQVELMMMFFCVQVRVSEPSGGRQDRDSSCGAEGGV